jgi:hypothetical protein
MTTEIELLLKAEAKGLAVVDKETNVMWSRAELLQARDEGQFAGQDDLKAPDPHCPVTGPFPGCLNWGGADAGWYRARAVAQTSHFVIFELPAVGLRT